MWVIWKNRMLFSHGVDPIIMEGGRKSKSCSETAQENPALTQQCGEDDTVLRLIR
jgi:hypothetical protein